MPAPASTCQHLPALRQNFLRFVETKCIFLLIQCILIPRWPQDAQRSPKMPPRSSKMPPRSPKMAHSAPKRPQDGPEMAPRLTQKLSKTLGKNNILAYPLHFDFIVPMMPQDGPKMPQDDPKMASRCLKVPHDDLKMASRWPQDGPKMALRLHQIASKIPPGHPRLPQTP